MNVCVVQKGYIFNEHGKMHKFHYETWMNALRMHRRNSNELGEQQQQQ